MGRQTALDPVHLTDASPRRHALEECQVHRIEQLWNIDHLDPHRKAGLELAIGRFELAASSGAKRRELEEASAEIATAAAALLHALSTSAGSCLIRFALEPETRIVGTHFIKCLKDANIIAREFDELQFSSLVDQLLFELASIHLGLARKLPRSIDRTENSSARNKDGGTIAFSGLCLAIAELLNKKPLATSTLQRKFIEAWPRIRAVFVRDELIDDETGNLLTKPHQAAAQSAESISNPPRSTSS